MDDKQPPSPLRSSKRKQSTGLPVIGNDTLYSSDRQKAFHNSGRGYSQGLDSVPPQTVHLDLVSSKDLLKMSDHSPTLSAHTPKFQDALEQLDEHGNHEERAPRQKSVSYDESVFNRTPHTNFLNEHSRKVVSIRAMGARPMGFHAIANAKRMEKKERSTRRLSQSLRNMKFLKRPSSMATEKTPLKGDPSVEESFHDEPQEEDNLDDFLDIPHPSTIEALSDIVFGKYVSIFLIVMPFAWMAHAFNWGSQWVFWLNFLVMIPLAAILGDFTEEVAAHTNQVIGGLINATFGNAVEVVVAIQALMANEIRVVQASMIGSIFSNLLLVLGCCFFFGGLKFKEQSFNSTAATANMSLLALSSIALVLPTPFAEYYDINDEHVLTLSRVAAIFLVFMYLQLLVFQLKTHAYLFEDDDDEIPEIPMSVALIGLTVTTLAITVFSDMLVDSIDGFCETSGVSRTFVGLIILPIVGNAVEHVTAVTVAMKDKMDLAMGIAVGSCTQISLFVVPLTVLVGWGINKNMTLNFPHFEIILYVLSVFTVSVCVSNPKGNWLEGSLLITTYLMLALGFWYEKVEDF